MSAALSSSFFSPTESIYPLTMPNVFVTPPEEDCDPPFCCFDAAQPLEREEPTQDDLEGPGSALDIISQITQNSSPVFCRDAHSDVMLSMRSSGSRSTTDVSTGGDEYGESGRDITIREGNLPGDDSEIIEVVKVKRHNERGRSVIPPSKPTSSSVSAVPRPRSFKLRASKAFSSIRNVGRSASRNRKGSEVVDEAIASSSAPELSSRAPSPLSRRGSLILSSMFSHTSAHNSRPSSEPCENIVSPLPLSATSSVSRATEVHTPSYAEMQNFVPPAYTEDDGEIEMTPRAPRHALSVRSPSPTPGSSKLNRRRFSVLNLFSASKEMASSQPTIVTSSTSSLPALSQDSLDPFTTDSSESSVPTTPVDDDDIFPAGRTGRSLLRRLPSFTKGTRQKAQDFSSIPPLPSTSVDRAISKTNNLEHEPLITDDHELSFGELRLDSLHFDELSFDANRF